MKDFKYILSKLLKKHTIPLLLLTVAMVLFFINPFCNYKTLAQEQIAIVNCCVNVVDEAAVENVCYDSAVLTNGSQNVLNFGDIDVNLNSRSKLEIEYEISNIGNNVNYLSINLNDENLSNFKVEYYVDDEFIGNFEIFEYNLDVQKIVKVKIVLSIENVARNACFEGEIVLNIDSLGGK